jgi:hypothetical protein
VSQEASQLVAHTLLRPHGYTRSLPTSYVMHGIAIGWPQSDGRELGSIYAVIFRLCHGDCVSQEASQLVAHTLQRPHGYTRSLPTSYVMHGIAIGWLKSDGRELGGGVIFRLCHRDRVSQEASQLVAHTLQRPHGYTRSLPTSYVMHGVAIGWPQSDGRELGSIYAVIFRLCHGDCVNQEASQFVVHMLLRPHGYTRSLPTSYVMHGIAIGWLKSDGRELGGGRHISTVSPRSSETRSITARHTNVATSSRLYP